MPKYIGMDLGNSSLKAVSIANKDGHLVIDNAYMAKTPQDTLAEGAVINYAKLSEEIAKLVEAGSFGMIPVSLAIKGAGTVAKRVKVPYILEETLQDDLRYVAQQYMSVDPESYSIDYNIIRLNRNLSHADVLFAATRKDILSDYVSILESADQIITIIDLEVFALYTLYSFLNLPTNKTTLIIEIGSSLVQMIFIKDGTYSYYTTCDLGGNYCSSLLINNSELDAESVEDAKLNPEESAQKDKILSVINDNYSKDLADAINEGILKYKLAGGEDITMVYLSGGGASLSGLQEGLGNHLKLPVNLMDARGRVDVDSAVAAKFIKKSPTIFNVALGMALR